MSYKKNAQVEVLLVVDLCKKSAKQHFFCGRCNTGEEQECTASEGVHARPSSIVPYFYWLC